MTALRRLAGGCAVIAVAAILATGCSSSTDDTDNTPAPVTSTVTDTPSDDPANPLQPGPTSSVTSCRGADTCSGEGVIVTGLRTLFGYRSTDSDPAVAAAGRAQPWLCTDYAASVGGTWALLLPVTGGLRTQWATAHPRITTTVDLVSDEHPADTATTTYRVAAITLHTAGVTNDVTQPVWVTATNHGSGWCINSIATQS